MDISPSFLIQFAAVVQCKKQKKKKRTRLVSALESSGWGSGLSSGK